MWFEGRAGVNAAEVSSFLEGFPFLFPLLDYSAPDIPFIAREKVLERVVLLGTNCFLCQTVCCIVTGIISGPEPTGAAGGSPKLSALPQIEELPV